MTIPGHKPKKQSFFCRSKHNLGEESGLKAWVFSLLDLLLGPFSLRLPLGLSSLRQVFSLLGLLLGPFSLRLPLGLSSLRQVFSLLGLLLGSFSLRLIPLGLSSLCQGFLFIRSSLKSLFFTSSFRFIFSLPRFSLRSLFFTSSFRSIFSLFNWDVRFRCCLTNWDLNVAVVNYYDGTNA
ncbi:uncharacterized protein OCT59_028751 [Rhizophagus irregularis]|uniref:uncharacterized protein n=1 Tax=Rhizophagus irregularis TaxID=588596 RepID=UPI0019DECCE9|nr:hypothetical protein OCT59_028751 [Rhizophagus irregularis]GBC52617.2 hypothetical protein GLOIN_2v1485120 [Rhizophagus irregularis DAOM 181602=DAOM 197198]